MKVFHVTTWYPNDLNPHEAMWIRRQIEALSPYVEEYFVLHLEVKPSNRFLFNRGSIAHGVRRRLELPLRWWFLIEVLTALFLVYYLFKYQAKKYSIINFHIAYPSLVYWHIFKRWFSVPTIINEHWSAYHFGFGVSDHRNLARIKRIFYQNIPVVAVSRALANDIRNFSQAEFDWCVVPNVVDEGDFWPDRSVNRENSFFMVSQWKWPKKPLVVFEAFKQFVKTRGDFTLKVAGYGNDYSTMADWVREHDMQHRIVLLGALSPAEVAACLRTVKAFLHCTEYETFSVVCAEAVSCATPVLASKVGGVAEVVLESEGILVGSNEVSTWADGMEAILNVRIASPDDRFSKKRVGEMYYGALSRLLPGGQN